MLTAIDIIGTLKKMDGLITERPQRLTAGQANFTKSSLKRQVSPSQQQGAVGPSLFQEVFFFISSIPFLTQGFVGYYSIEGVRKKKA